MTHFTPFFTFALELVVPGALVVLLLALLLTGEKSMPGSRRFPPPWDIEEANAACFIVKDNNGQALAYVYFEQEPGRRAGFAKLLTRNEARRSRFPAGRAVAHLCPAASALPRPRLDH